MEGDIDRGIESVSVSTVSIVLRAWLFRCGVDGYELDGETGEGTGIINRGDVVSRGKGVTTWGAAKRSVEDDRVVVIAVGSICPYGLLANVVRGVESSSGGARGSNREERSCCDRIFSTFGPPFRVRARLLNQIKRTRAMLNAATPAIAPPTMAPVEVFLSSDISIFEWDQEERTLTFL